MDGIIASSEEFSLDSMPQVLTSGNCLLSSDDQFPKPGVYIPASHMHQRIQHVIHMDLSSVQGGIFSGGKLEDHLIYPGIKELLKSIHPQNFGVHEADDKGENSPTVLEDNAVTLVTCMVGLMIFPLNGAVQRSIFHIIGSRRPIHTIHFSDSNESERNYSMIGGRLLEECRDYIDARGYRL